MARILSYTRNRYWKPVNKIIFILHVHDKLQPILIKLSYSVKFSHTWSDGGQQMKYGH